MKVLINAYACSPTWGSEPGMGWNWITNLAKYCKLYVITEGEWKNDIEKCLGDHPYKENMKFYFLPVNEKIRKMCWNQGDWRFYYYYDKWQKRALKLARQIIEDEGIDIIHQLNMVGFREPGYLWKIDKPFVWGPIGGMEDLPINYLEGASFKQKILLCLKNCISDFQLKYSSKIDGAFKKADSVISAVPAVLQKVEKYKHIDSVLISETGCYNYEVQIDDKRNRKDFNILWVGRFIYTKRLDIALKSISLVKSLPNIHFHIVGTGSDVEVKYYKNLANDLGLSDICIWHGKVNNNVVHEMMKMADLFFFTSIMEATSTVVPEAINNCLPILCFNTCGFGHVVTEKIGRKIELSAPERSVVQFSQEIEYLYGHRDVLLQMSKNCHQALKSLLWENKAIMLYNIYKKALA